MSHMTREMREKLKGVRVPGKVVKEVISTAKQLTKADAFFDCYDCGLHQKGTVMSIPGDAINHARTAGHIVGVESMDVRFDVSPYSGGTGKFIIERDMLYEGYSIIKECIDYKEALESFEEYKNDKDVRLIKIIREGKDETDESS